MCMQCVGAAGTALQAATLFGGPVAYKYYRRARRSLGLPDNSAAAEAARLRAGLPEPEQFGLARALGRDLLRPRDHARPHRERPVEAT
jgi:hypothetical protein